MLKICKHLKVPSGGRAEIKNIKIVQSVTFSISALPPEGAILSIYKHLVKKKLRSNFERRPGRKTIKQKVPGGLFSSDFSTMYS